MCCDWFSVYLENHLNLVIAQTIRYLTMSSLAAFRSLRVQLWLTNGDKGRLVAADARGWADAAVSAAEGHMKSDGPVCPPPLSLASPKPHATGIVPRTLSVPRSGLHGLWLNGFMQFIPTPSPPAVAGKFIGALLVSNYLVVVFALDLLSGALLLGAPEPPMGSS